MKRLENKTELTRALDTLRKASDTGRSLSLEGEYDKLRIALNVAEDCYETLKESIAHLTQIKKTINISSKLYHTQLPKFKNKGKDRDLDILNTMINSPESKHFTDDLITTASERKIIELVQILNNWFYDNHIDDLEIQQNLEKPNLYRVLVECIRYIDENHPDLSETFKFAIVTSLQ